MKNKYVREIRHIVANYSLKKNATAYHIDPKSLTFKIISDLIKRNWIESKYVSGQFLFVGPADILKKTFRTGDIESKISAVPALKRNLIRNERAENLRFKFPEIIAA
ncbi:MAG: hypothetical protein ABR968_06535 [Bacteroidales bacterium]|jgi:hypothetical protein